MMDMCRNVSFIAISMMIAIGCASQTPVDPRIDPSNPGLSLQTDSIGNGPHRLYGEWTFFINESHDGVDVVPRREGRFHLNALKFLESYCTDCLKITKIKNNGDSTIDLTVQIKHPFPGFPQYTGFDVKGVIMFNGSWECESYYFWEPPYPEPFRVSWRKLGDPQVLNADGYTMRWSPWWESGSDMPIFNYWPGKHSNGTPTANINAYLDFYTDENRHMFANDGQVSRTYHIWLPPGQPVVAGYAVEACWEPPLKMPVTDPANDFPLTANQPEAYEFYFNLNNGQVITDPDCCGVLYDPSEGYMFSKQWGGHTALDFAIYSDYYEIHSGIWPPCGDEWPDEYCVNLFNAANFPDGEYIGVAINYKPNLDPPYTEHSAAFSLFEFTIDLQ
jgi:hypothetical protein